MKKTSEIRKQYKELRQAKKKVREIYKQLIKEATPHGNVPVMYALYLWAKREISQGNIIASINEKENTYKQVIIKGLEDEK